MYFYNATWEEPFRMCNGKPFQFKKKDKTFVDDDLAPLLEEELFRKGIFALKSGINVKERTFDALRSYLENTLYVVRGEWNSYYDMQKKNGATVVFDKKYQTLLRQIQELEFLLKVEAPLVEYSYLTPEQRQQAGIKGDIEFVTTENSGGMFDPASMVVEIQEIEQRGEDELKSMLDQLAEDSYMIEEGSYVPAEEKKTKKKAK